MPTYCDEAPGFDQSILVRLWPALHAFTKNNQITRTTTPAMPTPAEKPPAPETVDPCPSCDGVGRLDSLNCICPACHGKRKRVDAPARAERRG